MDMEEIILEHIEIREWADKFVKEALKNQRQEENDRNPACK